MAYQQDKPAQRRHEPRRLRVWTAAIALCGGLLTQPAQAQPVQAQPVQAQPVQAQPVQAQPVQAQEDVAPDSRTFGSLGRLTVGIGVGLGFHADSRACDTAGSARTLGGSGCALFLGGVDGSFLWRGALGATLGLWSVSGQAAVAQGQPPSGQAPAAFPDRISIPLMADVRPLAFAKLGLQGSYLRRVSHGIRVALGPSVEIVRTASDTSIQFGERAGNVAQTLFGLHGSLDGELPLLTSMASSLSLRLSLRWLYVPIIVLNDGAVQSSLVSRSDQTPNMLATSIQGYASHFQFALGLVYYL